MKSAIYIEEGVVQFVLTPETDAETGMVRMFDGKDLSVQVHWGGFYRCNGGWDRHERGVDGRSLIVRAVVS